MSIHQSNRRSFYSLRLTRSIVIGGAAVLITIGTALWALNSLGIIHGTWPDIFSSIFGGLGLIIALLQLIQPAREKHSRELNHPLVTSGILLAPDSKEGALAVYVKESLRGTAIRLRRDFISLNPNANDDIADCVNSRAVHNRICYLARFSKLEPGNYIIACEENGQTIKITVVPGDITEIDWQ